MNFKDRKRVRWTVAVTLATVVAFCAWLFRPVPETACRSGVALACTRSWYVLSMPDADTLYFRSFDADGLPVGLALNVAEVQHEFQADAFFVSYSGRIVTAADTVEASPIPEVNALYAGLETVRGRLVCQQNEHRILLDEMAYYERTHTVTDEGFHAVMEHKERVELRLATLERMKPVLDKALSERSALVRLHRTYTLYYKLQGEPKRKWHEIDCRRVAEQSGGVAVWQTVSWTLPEGVARFRLNPWPYGVFHGRNTLFTFWGRWTHYDVARTDGGVYPVCVRMRNAVPAIPLPGRVGSVPCFGPWGCLNGAWVHGRFVNAVSLYRQMMGGDSWPFVLWQDFRAWGLRLEQKVGRMLDD